jgi:hypothetical protein
LKKNKHVAETIGDFDRISNLESQVKGIKKTIDRILELLEVKQ